MSTVVESKANLAIELDNKIRLYETLWSGCLVPTEMLIEEIDELISTLTFLEKQVPDAKPVAQYIRRMKRKRAKYQKALKEEVASNH